MSAPDPASEIVSKLGASVLNRLVRGVIRDLQAMKDALTSGDDSGLESTWDEVCVQVQYQESVCWELYLETIETCAVARVDELPELMLQAAWLGTPQGEDWSWEEEDEREAFGVCTDDIVQSVVDRVLARADDWSNPRIRGWLDRRYGD